MKPGKLNLLKDNKQETNNNRFPIAGIGASAGGLEALELFLTNIPENSGFAFVVIQHLDPTQKGMLPELLQRVTKMVVHQVKDRMAVKPNCVYVIPPNKSMSVLKGVLYLFEPIEDRGMRLPIDFFFNSLAADWQEFAVGVVLSGMGSDGSAGLKAIKANNGTTAVQDPSSAKFDSMPRNAVESVPIDIIAPANELPNRLMAHFKNFPAFNRNHEIIIKDKSSLDKIIILLRAHTGNDFSLYKKNTVYRRIERRMTVHKLDKISAYVRFLQENPKELDILFKELMIGVTNFFRDTTVWDKLKTAVIPDLIAKLHPNSILRAWVPACSTGDEAYSLAIIFKEALEKTKPHGGITLQIFASDLDTEGIETARKGLFPQTIADNVSSERLKRFFIKTDDGYQVNTEIREMVVFAQHNIIMHPPFTKIDIISCRNLLIYMDAELQKRIIGLFYYSLNPEGVMVLGTAETLGAQAHLFTPVDSKLKIFKRSINGMKPDLFDFPSSFSRSRATSAPQQIPDVSSQSIQSLTDQMLLRQFSPAGVLVNENGDIVYTSGRTGKYLEPAVGKANLNIFAMLREGLRTEFPIAFRKALRNKEAVVLRNIKVGTNNGSQYVNINIQWLDQPEALHAMVLVIFTDVHTIPLEGRKRGKASIDNNRLRELENELQLARDEIKGTLEEMQLSQEELKSTNEELQSANEELQSTNEELTSSKEEMQSLNEELQTVNAELQSKVDDFSRGNSDMKNLLNSTDIATLFLDKDLKIRRFTNQSTKIFKLIKSDIGRPFTDLVSDLIYPDLATDAVEVLHTLIFIQKQVPTKDGRWFSIRIMPYRTLDDRIDGLVITFINMSDLKQLEEELNQTGQLHRLLLNSSPDVIIKLSSQWKILEFNPEAEKFFGRKRDDAINQNYIQTFIPEPVRKKTERELIAFLNEARNGKFKMQVIANGGNNPMVEWAVHLLFNNQKLPAGMIIIAKRDNNEN